MSYRNSHQNKGKGTSYHKSFKELKYRRLIWEIEKKYLTKILRKFYKKETKVNHLDFACGTGRILGHLESKTNYSMGVDISKSMIEEAKKNVKSEIFEADITTDKNKINKKFNLITAFRFFPNAENNLREESLRSLLNYLENDGYLVFNNHRNINSIISILRNKLFGTKLSGMGIDEVNDLLNQNNLRIIKIYSMGLFPDSYNNKYIPSFILFIIENIFHKIYRSKNSGYNQIFVCQKLS